MTRDQVADTAVFCYFDRPDHGLIEPFLAEWRAAFFAVSRLQRCRCDARSDAGRA